MAHGLVRLSNDIPDQNLDTADVGIVRQIQDSLCQVFFVGTKQLIYIEHNELVFIDPANYGDLNPEKICNVCHRILETAEFDLNQSGKGDRPVRRPSCKSCRKTIDGKAMSSAEKREWEKIKPKLIDFECPICKKVTIAGVTSKVVLNHDHSTGKILGWVCDSCNTGLGRFKDDVKVLQEAINYLETH